MYTGTKRIKACPMTFGDFNTLKGVIDYDLGRRNELGYFVVYPLSVGDVPNIVDFDGYCSWSPRAPFEEAYKPSNTWQERLGIEAEEIEERLKRLENYLHEQKDNVGNETGPTRRQFELLSRQCEVMREYAQIIRERIDIENNGFEE